MLDTVLTFVKNRGGVAQSGCSPWNQFCSQPHARCFPIDERGAPNAASIPGQRHRRWPGIYAALAAPLLDLYRDRH